MRLIKERDPSSNPNTNTNTNQVRLIKERDPDVIIQISTGGRAPPVQFEGVDVGDWRMDPLNLMPEMASYTPGSVHLGDPNPSPSPNPNPYPNPDPDPVSDPNPNPDPDPDPNPRQVNLGAIVYQNDAKLVKDMI